MNTVFDTDLAWLEQKGEWKGLKAWNGKNPKSRKTMRLGNIQGTLSIIN